MSLLHLFSFYETQHHPMIARAVNPYAASKVWGVFQFACAIAILAFTPCQLGRNLPSLLVLLGFCSWAIFLGVASGKRYGRGQEDESS